MGDDKLLRLVALGLGGALVAGGQHLQGSTPPGRRGTRKGHCTPCAGVKRAESFRRRRGLGP